MNKILILLFCTSIAFSANAQEKTIAEKLAQEQLDAYNKKDIEAFLKPYSDTLAVYSFPNQLMYKGKDIMRKEYGEMFSQMADLHCNLKNRIVLGNRVIDEESVIFDKTKPPLRAIAIYTIAQNKIVAVHFIME
jgi:hypothetical protein